MRRLLDFVFSQHDLAWIDNIIPEKEKKKEDDKKKKKKGNKGDSSSDEEVGTGSPGGSPGWWGHSRDGEGKCPPKPPGLGWRSGIPGAVLVHGQTRLSEGLKGWQEAPGNVPKAGKSRQRKGNQGEEPKCPGLGHGTHRSKPLCNSCPGIWEGEGKASSSSSRGFESLWKLQAVSESHQALLSPGISPFLPQFPPPSVIKIPMEPLPAQPQNGGPHCLSRKYRAQEPPANPSCGLRSALTPLDTHPDHSWITGIWGNPGGERHRSRSCQSTAHPKARASPRFP